MPFRPLRLLLPCLLIPALLPPGGVSGETAWFVSTPSGAPVASEKELRPSAEESPWEMALDLDRIARRGEEAPLPVDLSRHQVVGRSGPFRLQVGQQAPVEESLILRDFRRRGFSLNMQGGPVGAGVTGFVVQGQPHASSDDRLGLADEENRVRGVAGEISPFSRGPLRVELSAAYLSGQRPGRAEGDPQEGEAWTAAVEAGLWRKLRLRGEVAGSRFLPGDDWEQREGEALSFLARYQSSFRPDGKPPVEWHVGVDSQQIDPLFYSLGNAALGADQERTRLFGGVRQDRLGLSGSVGRERNNIEDNPRLATLERYDYLLQVQYALRKALGIAPWLGTPRSTLILDGFRRQQVEAPSGSPTAPTDESQKRLQCRVDFAREGWQWGAGYRVSAYRDFAEPKDDRRQNTVDLRLEARVGERLSLFPTAEFGTTSFDGGKTDMARLGLSAKAVLIPDWLKSGWDLSFSREELASGGWERNTALSGDLTYTLRPPARGRSGFDLTLSGSHREREAPDRPWLERRDYRLFLALTMILPPPPG